MSSGVVGSMRQNVATLNNKVQLLLWRRKVASLIEKAQHLLPSDSGDDFQCQVENSFDVLNWCSPSQMY